MTPLERLLYEADGEALVLDDAATVRLDAVLATWTRAQGDAVLGELATLRAEVQPLVHSRQEQRAHLRERVAMWDARALEAPEPLATQARDRAATLRVEEEGLAAEAAEYETTLRRFDEIERFIERRLRR